MGMAVDHRARVRVVRFDERAPAAAQETRSAVPWYRRHRVLYGAGAAATALLALLVVIPAVRGYLDERDRREALDHVRRLRGAPLYYLGDRFENLDLTYVDYGPGRAYEVIFIYGDCEPKGFDGGCPAPLELQNRRCSNGRTGVAIYANDPDQMRRAGRALRVANRPSKPGRADVAFDGNPFGPGC